jgi:ribulose-5-phosphate 4-epimerase/fuculose-1-phosphate aldolase
VFILGSIFADGVPVYDDPDLIFTDAQGDAVAETLGSARAAVLRGHGAIVAGASLEETFAASVYLEENAKKQYAAAALGKVRIFTPDEARRVQASLWKPKTVKKVWDFYVSKGRALEALADE